MHSNTYQLPSVLSIAGTDPTCGAGIQADMKAISATGSYAATVITALVAQNTQGVLAIEKVSPHFIKKQINAVLTDMSIKAIKIGMLHNAATIHAVADSLWQNVPVNIVLDPVMVAKDGTFLIQKEILATLKERLMPLATLITPNLFEAGVLLGHELSSLSDMQKAAVSLGESLATSVLVKGGHLQGKAAPDVLFNFKEKTCYYYQAKRIDSFNTHGTGCSLSAAIASYLAQGMNINLAIKYAKAFITNAIKSAKDLQLGKGRGPIDHFYQLKKRRLSHLSEEIKVLKLRLSSKISVKI